MYKKETISAATQSCRPEKNRSSKPLFTGSTAITQTETQPETPLLKKEIEKKKHKYRPGRYEPANSLRSERSCYKIAGIYRHQPAAEKKNRPNQPGTKKKQHDPEKSPLFRRISKEQLVKESLHDQLLSYKNDYILQYYTAQTGNLQGRCKKNRRREYSSTCANCFGSLPVTGQAFPLCRRI